MPRARGWRRRSWQRRLFLALLVLVLLLSCPPTAAAADANPYTVLGLPRTASERDIKKAYRRLSKLHHPDKSADPAAQSRFHEVNAAYELLGDKDRRAHYDRFGRVDSQQQQQHAYRQQQYGNPWAYMQQQQQQQQQRYSDYQLNADSVAQAIPLVRKITADNFDTLVSSHVPAQQRTAEVWLLFAYTTDCAPCTALHPHIARLTALLQTTGLYRVVKIGRVHSDYESSLVRQLGVRTLPHITSIVHRPDGRRHTQALSYHLLNYDNICAHLATQLIHTHSIIHLHTLAGTNRQRTIQLIKQRIDTPDHAAQPDLYVLSTASASPSLAVAYAVGYFGASFKYHFVYVPALLTASLTVAELAVELGVEAGQLGGADNVFVRSGYHLPTLRHVLSFDGQANVDDVVRALQPWRWVAVPQLRADNYFDLCVNKRTPSTTSLLQPSTTASTAHRSKQCLVLLAPSQQAADTTAAPLISQPTTLSQPSHATQLVWLNPATQPRWLAAYTAHAQQPATTALLIRPQTGQYRIAPPQLPVGGLVAWLGSEGAWRAMWVPLLDAAGGGWLEGVMDLWDEVGGSDVIGWLSGSAVGGLLRSVGLWMLLLLGASMFLFMMLLARA